MPRKTVKKAAKKATKKSVVKKPKQPPVAAKEPITEVLPEFIDTPADDILPIELPEPPAPEETQIDLAPWDDPPESPIEEPLTADPFDIDWTTRDRKTPMTGDTFAPAAEMEPEEYETVVDFSTPDFAIIVDGRSQAELESEGKAVKLAELVKSGKSLKRAAADLGISPSILRRSESMQKIVTETLNAGHLTAAVRREFVRAGLNLTLASALETGDGKLAVDAAKQIAQDPDVNLSGLQQPGVVIDIGSLADLLKDLKPPEGVLPPPGE